MSGVSSRMFTIVTHSKRLFRDTQPTDILDETDIHPFTQRKKFKHVAQVIARVSRVYQQNREIETLPELHLDNYFIVWGLRYRKYGDRRKNGWRLWYQRIALIYQILISLKWILVSIVSFYTQDEHILMVLGDFTAYLGGTREYYHFLITFATLYPTVFMIYCYVLRDDEKNFDWLKPFEVMKRTLKPADVELTEHMAVQLWKRIRYSMWNFEVIRIPVGVISITIVAYCLFDEMEKDEFLNYGWIWIVLQVPWVWFTVTSLIGLVNVFACVCYYFVKRFQKLEIDVRALNEYETKIATNDRNEMIWSFLKEFDIVCNELRQFNYFWQLFIFLHYFVYLPIIFVGLFEKFIAYENISAYHMTLISFLTFLAFCGWTYVALCAASVTKHAHAVYVPLNRLAMADAPVALKTQLENFVRRLGGPTIGFNCYRMFTPTHECYFNVIMFLGSYFLLILDAPDVRRKYHV